MTARLQQRGPSLRSALFDVPAVDRNAWNCASVLWRWLLACRASVLPLTAFSCVFGGLLARPSTAYDALLWMLATIGLVFAHATNNLLNDHVDFRTGLDTGNYFRARYGAHPLQQGLLSVGQHLGYICFTGMIAAVAGFIVCLARGATAWVLMGVGAAFVLFYTYPLKRMALGELSVLIVWGPLMVGGAFLATAGYWSWSAALLGLLAGLGPTAVIVAKHTDKRADDAARALYTLPVLLGDTRARQLIWLLAFGQIAAAALLSLGVGAYGFLVLLFALPAAVRLYRSCRESIPEDRPPDYPANLWPLWYTVPAFRYARSAGGFLLLGLLTQMTVAGEALAASQQTTVAAREIAAARDGLREVIAAMQEDREIFPEQALLQPKLLQPDQRDRARSLWATFADRLLALEHSDPALNRAAFLARYRFAMDFIEIANRDPGLDKLFDEAHPGLGLPAGSYARLKLHYLHVARATEFAALELLHRTQGSMMPEPLEAGANADVERILEMGRGTGVKMTAENAVKVVADTARAATLPAQEGVARWAGNIRVRRHGEALISTAQARELTATLQPGDVLLQRREWYLTNAGIPGFWTHAALYIGTEAERTDFFDDPDVFAWAREQGHASFKALLRARHPDAYVASKILDADNPARVLEAIAEGVVFTSIEHSAAADSIAALRPRLSKQERAVALLSAFGYAGRPYDYDFDFGTDRALVCSELIYKSYQPSAGTRGLELPLEVVTGRLMMTPNDMARLFAGAPLDASRPFDFVTMLDGNERTDSAHPAGVEVFADSWHRPKWHIVIRP